MRNVLPVCAALVVISGIVSATLWHELRTQRQLTADLEKQLADANSRIQSLSIAAQRGGAQQAAVVAPAAPAAGTASPAPATSAPPSAVNASLQDFRAREKEMMADPEYRKARLAQQRMNTERNYPGLAEELGLSQPESDRLFDMLTESQMKMSEELTALFSGGQPDAAARAEITRKQQAFQREQEEQVAALLGAGRYQQWQDYKETQGGRVQALQMGTQLAQVGQPLSDVQQRGLTAVLVAEQKRMQQQMEPLMRSLDRSDPQAVMQLQTDLRKREDESNRRILEAAAAHLTARQIASLKQYYETQSAMSSAQIRMDLRRREVQGSGQAP